jgi:ribosomal protein S17E
MNKKDKLRVIEEANKKLLKEDSDTTLNKVAQSIAGYLRELESREDKLSKDEISNKLLGFLTIITNSTTK